MDKTCAWIWFTGVYIFQETVICFVFVELFYFSWTSKRNVWATKSALCESIHTNDWKHLLQSLQNYCIKWLAFEKLRIKVTECNSSHEIFYMYISRKYLSNKQAPHLTTFTEKWQPKKRFSGSAVNGTIRLLSLDCWAVINPPFPWF